MTSPGSSRAPAASTALPLLTLTIIVSTLLLGCLSPGASAAAAKDALKKATTDPSDSAGGGRATDAPAAAAAAGTTSPEAPPKTKTAVEWPEGMAGLWAGDYLPGSKLTEGMNAMVFITPGVAENLVFIFDTATEEPAAEDAKPAADAAAVPAANAAADKPPATEDPAAAAAAAAGPAADATADPDAIRTAMISENIGIKPREDIPSRAGGAGSFVWLNRAVATTDDELGGNLIGRLPGSTSTRCISATLEGDVMYVLGKDVPGKDDAAGDTGAFEGCPAAPVAADFQISADGAAPNLQPDADFGIMFKRSPMDEAVKWPAQLPGLWKGKILGSSAGSSAIGNDASPSKAVPMIGAVVQGSAINAWVYPDPEDAARVVSANIARANTSPAAAAAETTPEDATPSFSFVNHPFKYTAGADHAAGRQRWFNRVVINSDGKDGNDEMYVLANPAPGATDASPAVATPPAGPVAFPKAPDPAAVAAALDADDSAALAAAGAEVAAVLTKV